MKKLIDIPQEIVQDLKILAIKQNKDLKNFIQDHLVQLVRGEKKVCDCDVKGAYEEWTVHICKKCDKEQI